MTGKKIAIGIALAIIAAFAGAPIAEAQMKQVTAAGLAMIENDRVDLARDKAIQDALRKAVEQAVGTMVDSETRVQNYELLKDEIYTKTTGYIAKYDVIEEKKDGTLYYVTVKAYVKTANLSSDLDAIGLLIQAKENPRVMVIIGERTIGQVGWRHYWADMGMAENTIISALQTKGIEVIDKSTLARNEKNRYLVEKALNGDASAMMVLARGKEADLIISGNVMAKGAGSIAGSQMKTCQANITVKGVRADTGQVIAAKTGHAAYPHIDVHSGSLEAIKRATEEVAGDIIRQILDKWRNDIYNAGAIRIIVQQANLERINGLEQMLKAKVRGVKSVVRRQMAEGVGEVDLEAAQTVSEIENLLNKAKIAGRTVEIIGHTKNTITIGFKKPARKAQAPLFKVVLDEITFDQAELFVIKLKKIAGVSGAGMKTFEGSKGIFNLRFKGNAGALASHLKTIQIGDRFTKVVGLSGNEITLSLQK